MSLLSVVTLLLACGFLGSLAKQVDRNSTQVEYHSDHKYVHNRITNQTFVLYQRDTPKPQPASPRDLFFEVPLNGIGVKSLSALPFIEMFGLRDRIAYVGWAHSAPSSCIQRLYRDRKISSFPQDFLYSMNTVGDYPTFDESSFEEKTIQTQRSEDSDVQESAEWLRFYATFFNLEEKAAVIARDMMHNYHCIKERAATNAKYPKPVIAWTGVFERNGETYIEISMTPYKVNLTTDAGATMIDIDSIHATQKNNSRTTYGYAAVDLQRMAEGSLSFTDMEPTDVYHPERTASLFAYKIADAREVLKDVDILIDETSHDLGRFGRLTFGRSLTAENVLNFYRLNESDTQLNFIKNKAIFREDRSSGWGTYATAMPDAALEDVVNMVHPGFNQFHWMRNVYSDQEVIGVRSTSCEDPEAKLANPATICHEPNGFVIGSPRQLPLQ
ncbi:hypothetical protein K493DRAFT_341058 [Basidiobolus meristosporus CBS 931.73]|uniref:Uncharacterized protein n=1 Tax=Basidiobolus meristosporus CBS 931.73 TaxID=1314790 RepID=A0A1Y1XSV6_9FUNG|nr:hypothetical protein K493DRAFT_341058 [Basidiobolus meristosporus CBS 931.73]|eukprot:ORX88820.1 hypothetical protein K493DRAFT_341058 [Basidiobolus meristosporus CBS 931.73]